MVVLRSGKGAMAELDAKMDTMLSKLTNVDSVLGKIDARLAGFDSRLDTLQCEMSGIRADFTSQKKEIGKIRKEVSALQANVGANTNKLAEHDTDLEAVRVKLADMEDRSRRCNVRIIGLPEGTEGSNAIQFLTQNLPKWFPSLSDLQGEIMRAHRIYSTGATNVRARTLIFCCLRYTVRQGILAAARKNPPVIAGRKLRFSPDYSAHTLRRRLAFSSTMNQARASGIEFFLIYPATLKIKSKDGAMETFQCPKRAEEYLTSLLRGHTGAEDGDADN